MDVLADALNNLVPGHWKHLVDFNYLYHLPKTYTQLELLFRLSRQSDMLAVDLFSFQNLIFVFIIANAIIQYMLQDRWLPRRKFPNTGTDLSVILMMTVHSIWYIWELQHTQMMTLFREMAIHHFFSLLLFSHTLLHPNLLCVWYLVPFLLHSIYWATNGKSDAILYIYNLSFVLVCMIFYYYSVKHRTHSRVPCIVGLSICGSNYLNYCYSKHGEYCIPRDDSEDRFTEMGKDAALIWGCGILVFVSWVEMKPWETSRSNIGKRKARGGRSADIRKDKQLDEKSMN